MDAALERVQEGLPSPGGRATSLRCVAPPQHSSSTFRRRSWRCSRLLACLGPTFLNTLSGNERGVAITEAVLALPVLLVLLAACLYFHGAYRATLRAHREASVAAWARASATDCESMGEQRSLGGLSLDERVSPYVADSSGAGYARISGVAEATHAVPNAGSFRARMRVVLTCNAKTGSLDSAGVLGAIVESIGGKPW